jgi:hypothetical protein
LTAVSLSLAERLYEILILQALLPLENIPLVVLALHEPERITGIKDAPGSLYSGYRSALFAPV